MKPFGTVFESDNEYSDDGEPVVATHGGDASKPLTDSCTVYVGGGLPPDIQEDQIFEHFVIYESDPGIVSIDIPTDKASGNATGYCFVTFSSTQAAKYAISSVSGTLLFGKYKLVVNHKTKPSHDKRSTLPSPATCSESLRTKHGRYSKGHLKTSGRARPPAAQSTSVAAGSVAAPLPHSSSDRYCHYDDHQSDDDGDGDCDEGSWDGKDEGSIATQHEHSSTVYVGNGFPPYIKEGHIHDHFTAHGFGACITKIVMPFNKALQGTKGFAFVTFDSPGAAENAISIMNGTLLLALHKKPGPGRSLSYSIRPYSRSRLHDSHSRFYTTYSRYLSEQSQI
eukprot:Em0015g996a